LIDFKTAQLGRLINIHYLSSKYLATSIKDVANLVCSQSDVESGELIKQLVFKNYL
jgi:hypothetical protein